VAEKEQVQSFKQVESILAPLGVDDRVKADAFDAYFDSPNEEAFTKKFKGAKIPDDAKAALWDLRFGQEQKQRKESMDITTPTAMGRVAVAEAPAIGGTVGGLTMGIPGAVAGGIVGQGVKRALQYRKGETPPAQAGEFAADVGLEGAKQGAFEVGGRAAGAAMGGLKKIAQPLYKSTLTFSGLESLPARREAAQQGVRLGASVREAPKGMPRVEQFVSDMAAKVNAEIAKAKAAGVMVDTDKILEPVRAQIAEYTKSLAPTKPTEAAREIEREIILRLGGQEINVAGPGGKVVKQLVPGPRYMDPEEAQVAKRATSRTLRKAYGEEKGPAIETLKAGERGAKEAIESAVPGVKDPNWQEHVALTLQDSMERTLKQKPGWAKGLMPYLIGGAAAGALTGHMTPAMIISLAAHEAVRNPAVMSRLAIWLNRAGTKLPKVAEPFVKYTLRAGTPLLEEMPPTRLEQNEIR